MEPRIRELPQKANPDNLSTFPSSGVLRNVLYTEIQIVKLNLLPMGLFYWHHILVR